MFGDAVDMMEVEADLAQQTRRRALKCDWRTVQPTTSLQGEGWQSDSEHREHASRQQRGNMATAV